MTAQTIIGTIALVILIVIVIGVVVCLITAFLSDQSEGRSYATHPLPTLPPLDPPPMSTTELTTITPYECLGNTRLDDTRKVITLTRVEIAPDRVSVRLSVDGLNSYVLLNRDDAVALSKALLSEYTA